MASLLYNLLLVLFSPVIALFYGYRLLRGKESRAHWRERLGDFPEAISRDPRTPRFWIHAVSVGEVMAATPVLRELRTRYPDALIVLSVTTTGGREVAQNKVLPADYVVNFPLDFPFAVARAMRAVRPTALLLMEWEIWPNLLAAAKRSGATIAVINGRISDKGLKRGTSAKWFLAPALTNVDIFAMQSDEDARRALIVGAPESAIRSVGNTKFDEAVATISEMEREEMRRAFGISPEVPVWLCGSTRNAPSPDDPDEEVLIAQAFATLRQTIPNLQLVIAPRHLERADAAIRPFVDAGFTIQRRSLTKDAPIPSDVLLLDTFGELGRAYAVADVAFVGGSLVKQGGQSVFQPLAQGVPAVFGTYMSNQRDISALAQAEGVGFPVANSEELAATVARLIALSPADRASISMKCRALIERNQGVTGRALDIVAAVFGEHVS